ncbi:protein Wnt-4-like [Clavelina lepadiformis]|uniref:protein Wnt-4-like n=1 Tax=Clavelina lepadiformis TaxID=159417 RepID=UPI0040436F1B
MKIHKKNRLSILLTYFIWSWSALLTSATWWLFTVPSIEEFRKERADVDAKQYCDSLRLMTPSQSEFCLRHPTLMQKVSEGLQNGVRECQYQFRNSRWNCSIYPAAPKYHAFKPIIKSSNREAAYIHSIFAASVSYEVTRACSSGDVPEECGCAKIGKRTDSNHWGGCSDNIRFGDSISKEFFTESKPNSAKARLMLHNGEAGRRTVRANNRVVCKCHGLSGACTQNVCWRAMPRLRNVSRILKEKFDGAVAVKPRVKPGKKLRPAQKDHVNPTANDLVYIRKKRETDYCEKNLRLGSYGTRGRLCNETSQGTDGCGIMCCDRGFERKRIVKQTKCNCTFEWCCKVKCQECREELLQTFCV